MTKAIDRRQLMTWGAVGAAGVLLIPRIGAGANANPRVARFTIIEATLADIAAAFASGALTSTQLSQMYLTRMAAFDRRGPKINSVIELNPDALAMARQCDVDRKAGRLKGPLHGVPVLLKDNVATGDKMMTSVGSLALADAPASADAYIVQQLRKAGAVILGKTNLSEWANIRSTRSTSGWSSRGGLTKNPYALDRNTSGSSSGSAAAIASSFAAVAVGTETDGSITSPASINGLVGIKPTVGLVSRYGIVPISHTQDTAGPMTRTVADAAALLSVLAGEDANDPATSGSKGKAADYLAALKLDALRGVRLGIARNFVDSHPQIVALFDQAVAVLKTQGAVVVESEIPNTDKFGEAELNVLLYELKADMPKYLAAFAANASVKNLDDIIRFNIKNRAKVMPYFEQELFDQAQKLGALTTPAYQEALALCKKYSQSLGIDKALSDANVTALIAPTGSPGWLTDLINGDHSGNSFTAPAAIAGYPHITVPMGAITSLPVGLSFVGPAYSESRLIGYAYAFEQSTKHRRPPQFLPTASVRRSDR
jgi:amidase